MPAYKLIRMNRKSISLSVDKDGTPIVKAPYGTSMRVINLFYNEKKDWLEKETTRALAEREKENNLLSKEVDTLTVLGKTYNVTHDATERKFEFDGKKFNIPNGTLKDLRPDIIRLYKIIANDFIKERIKFYAPIVGVVPGNIKITSASTRWGSCSNKKNLSFSWKLIFAPGDVIDYVIVHELCHIKQMNHSPAFWHEVEKIIPDWKDKRNKLKDVQNTIKENAFE